MWPQVAPHLGDQESTAAGKLGLPTDERALADLVAPRDLARMAAALTRVSRSQKELREIEAAAGR